MAGEQAGALLAHHQRLIEASAIDPAVAAARGYYSATEPDELRRLGFKGYQANVPALVIPLYRPVSVRLVGAGIGTLAATPAGYQIRPDAPRLSAAGKPIKYETAAGAAPLLDVPPGCRLKLGDPVYPLVITEGARKADALVSIGLTALSLAGVFGWRGKNGQNGSTALADWEDVALNDGRRVYLGFDSDVTVKPTVAAALDRLKRWLEGRGATVEVILLPAGPNGEKQGVDDWLARWLPAEAAAVAAEQARAAAGELSAEAARQWRLRATELGRREAAQAALFALARPELPVSFERASWPAPEPFGGPPRPAFPVAALPGWWGEYVAALAEATQTPPDLPAQVTLAVVAATVARRVVIQARPGWVEPLNLFTVTALASANRKSAVFREAVAPLVAYEARLLAQGKIERARATARRDVAARQLEALKQRVAKGAGLPEAVLQAAEAAEAIDVPPLPRLVCDDVTPEKLAGLLAEQGGRIALLSAEGGVFEMMTGRYTNKGPNLDVYLKGHAGDLLVVDRQGRATERIEHPALTVGLTVQPEVVHGLLHQPHLRGRGLLARFLYALPQSRVGHRDITPPPVPDAVREAYDAAVGRLLTGGTARGLGAGGWGLGDGRDSSTCTPSSPSPQPPTPSPHVLRLDAGAEAAFLAWVGAIEPALGTDGEMEAFADWGGKLAGQTARIAGLLHLARHVWAAEPWAVPVEADTVKRAIQIAVYGLNHARAFFLDAGADPRVSGAQAILRWLQREQRSTFTRREAQRALSGRFKRADDLYPALDELVDRGYLAREVSEARAQGGRPMESYRVNPRWLAGEA